MQYSRMSSASSAIHPAFVPNSGLVGYGGRPYAGASFVSQASSYAAPQAAAPVRYATSVGAPVVLPAASKYPLVNDAPTYLGGNGGYAAPLGNHMQLRVRARHARTGRAIPDQIKVEHYKSDKPEKLVQVIKIPTTFHENPVSLEPMIVKLLNEKPGVNIGEFGELEYQDQYGDFIRVNSATNFYDDIVPALRLRYLEVVPPKMDEKDKAIAASKASKK